MFVGVETLAVGVESSEVSVARVDYLSKPLPIMKILLNLGFVPTILMRPIIESRVRCDELKLFLP